MDLSVDNYIQLDDDLEGGCKCSMANNMSWVSQRRGRGRRRRSMLNVLFICLLILVSAGMVSSGLVLRDVASEKEVENGGSIHGSVVGTAAEQGRTTREFLHTRKVLQRVNMNPVLHRWGPRSLKDVGIPFILGRGHAADDRALHFRKRDVTDFFEAAPEWPEKVSEGGEDSETPAGGLVRPSGLPSKPLESEKTEKVTGSASETGQVKKEQFPELVMLDRAESTSRSDAQPQMDTTEGIIDPKNATSSPDFRNRDPEFDAQPHVLDKNIVAEFSQLTEGVEGEPEVLGTEVSINTDKVEQKPSLGLEYVEEHGTPSPTQSSEEDESPFADPEHAPILVLPSHRSIKVYIYELPSHLNRDFVARDPRVRETMFATEILIHENFEQSAVRTLDPEEADFYFIPVYTAGVLEESGRVIPDTSASTMLEAVTYVAENWQYFNRLRGLDHVVVAPHDYGACFQYRDELASQTKFRMALRYLTVLQTFGVHDHVCYRPGRSVVIPPYIDVKKLRQLDFAPERDPHEKTVLAFFRGLYIDAGNDPSGKVYSRGVRLAIGETFSHHPDFDISDKPSPTYLQDMVKATFCLCPLGWAPWSPRIFESVQIGCIPVIIADDIILPFEKYFNWERIAVRVKEADVPRLEEILKGIPPETVADMQKAMWDPKVRQALIFPEPAEHGDAFEMILNELESKVDRIRKKQAEYARKHGQ